eukprot:jgi/Chrzof1/12785/Cz07g07150.t1
MTVGFPFDKALSRGTAESSKAASDGPPPSSLAAKNNPMPAATAAPATTLLVLDGALASLLEAGDTTGEGLGGGEVLDDDVVVAGALSSCDWMRYLLIVL